MAPANAPRVANEVIFKNRLSVKNGKAPATNPLAAMAPPTTAHTAVVIRVGIPIFLAAKAVFGCIFFILCLLSRKYLLYNSSDSSLESPRPAFIGTSSIRSINVFATALSLSILLTELSPARYDKKAKYDLYFSGSEDRLEVSTNLLFLNLLKSNS